MVRISDARMSGTAYGTVILHVAPEAAAGGPLALIETGDIVEIDLEARRIHMDVPDDVLAARKARWTAPTPAAVDGYVRLILDHVQQPDQGGHFVIIVGKSVAYAGDNAH